MALDIVKQAKPFETADINGLELANHFVRSATWIGMAEENGYCTAQLQDAMVQLSHAGIFGESKFYGLKPFAVSTGQELDLSEAREMTADDIEVGFAHTALRNDSWLEKTLIW